MEGMRCVFSDLFFLIWVLDYHFWIFGWLPSRLVSKCASEQPLFVMSTSFLNLLSFMEKEEKSFKSTLLTGAKQAITSEEEIHISSPDLFDFFVDYLPH
ncbi:hypothetical protein V2J09_022885 [Rumex salicifolius]